MSLNRLVYCNTHFLTKDSAMYLKFNAVNLMEMEAETFMVFAIESKRRFLL